MKGKGFFFVFSNRSVVQFCNSRVRQSMEEEKSVDLVFV